MLTANAETTAWLDQNLGPKLKAILLDWLADKSRTTTLLPASAVASFNVNGFLVRLLQHCGPLIIKDIADTMNASSNIAEKMAATMLQQYGPVLLQQLVTYLQSTAGIAAVTAAVAAIP